MLWDTHGIVCIGPKIHIVNAGVGMTQGFYGQTVDFQFLQMALILPAHLFHLMDIPHGSYDFCPASVFQYLPPRHLIPAGASVQFQLQFHMLLGTVFQQITQFGNISGMNRFPCHHFLPVILHNFSSGKQVPIFIRIRHMHDKTVFFHIIFIQNVLAAFHGNLIQLPFLAQLQLQLLFLCNICHCPLVLLIPFQKMGTG